MIEEKKNLEFTNDELIEFIHTQRKMMCKNINGFN